jgi:transcriptional regulator GlxA family with amidase domain
LFDGVDLLDAGGPYEVFLTASRLAVRDDLPATFDVVTLTSDGGPVTAYGGLVLSPQASADAAGPFDVVIIPGAIDIDAAAAASDLLPAIAALTATGAVAASVCTGAFLLAAAGLLRDRAWTTHWEDVDALAERIGAAGARRGVRWIDEGPVVTAGGLSSGIAMALHLVDRFAGRDAAERTARQLDYSWAPDGVAG